MTGIEWGSPSWGDASDHDVVHIAANGSWVEDRHGSES